MFKFNNIYFREAQIKDIFIIQLLANKSWRQTYKHHLSENEIDYLLKLWYSQMVLENLINNKEYKFFLVIEKNKYSENEQPIGFFGYYLNIQNVKVLKITKLYLLPEKQRQGYGKQIISYIENEAKLIVAKMLELIVNKGNNAERFYKKQDFNSIREEEVIIGAFSFIDIIMQKVLD